MKHLHKSLPAICFTGTYTTYCNKTVMKRAFSELAPWAGRCLQSQAVPQGRAALVALPSVQAQWQPVAHLHQLQSLQTHYLNNTPSSSSGAGVQQKRSMFIQTQPTPNPSSMMFLPGKTVMEAGSMQFDNARESMKSPLAKKLFQVDGVTSVFFGSDFVTVTKSDDYTWNVVKPDIFAGIMDHFTSGDPLISETDSTGKSDTAINDDDSEVVAMIKELLETRIRPAVMEDGGDIVFKGFDEPSGIVTLKMQGACSGCPSSAVTLKGGIENMLMHYILEVKSVVEADPDESEVAGMTEFNKLEQHLSA